ncbi:MAG: hypothetical protein WC358_04335, partial [Ignavibacteria bacterium]
MSLRKINNEENKNILFYNSEKIGDLMVSSMILENDELFPDEREIYFLIKEEYYTLFEKYNGKIKIITYNYKKYKWNLPYRISFLKKIRSFKIDGFYNLT